MRSALVLVCLAGFELATAGPLEDQKLWDKANEAMQAGQKKVMENRPGHPSCGVRVDYAFDAASYKGLVYRPEAKDNPGLAPDTSPMAAKLWWASGCVGIFDGIDNFCMNVSGKPRQAFVDSHITKVICHYDDSVGRNDKGTYAGTPSSPYPVPKIVRAGTTLHYSYNSHSVNMLETTRDWLRAHL